MAEYNSGIDVGSVWEVVDGAMQMYTEDERGWAHDYPIDVGDCIVVLPPEYEGRNVDIHVALADGTRGITYDIYLIDFCKRVS